MVGVSGLGSYTAPMSGSMPAPGSALNAEEIASFVGGELIGSASGPFRSVAGVESASQDEVVFFRSGPDQRGATPKPELLEAVLATSAGLLVVDAGFPETERATVRVENPGLAAARLQQHWHGRDFPIAVGVHPAAQVDPSAQIAASASIAAGVVVGADCVIGEGVHLHPGVVVYPRVHLGDGCTIHANTVLGSPGFGYVWDGQQHQPMPQMGGVRIGRGVEIGANSVVDAGTMEPTVIGDGCILDNFVQVGHNCTLGRAVVLCAQVGLSGSTILEDGVVMGGQSGSGGHLRVGTGTQIAARGGATADIGPGLVVSGVPAVDIRLHHRMQAALRRLAKGRKS